LYRFLSRVPTSALQPGELLQKSSDYYARAVVLSPNNSVIWNEWALLHLNELDNTERGLELLMHSLEIDPYFDGTYGILGDYYAALARAATEDGARRSAAENAASYYTQALAETKRPSSRYLYAAAMGGVYELIDDLPAAINAYLLALENAEGDQIWLVEDTLAKVYARAGDFETALEYAALALAHAPAAQQAAQQQLIEEIEGMQTPP
jgi:tetratricopeptide (TPR) repeat protein